MCSSVPFESNEGWQLQLMGLITGPTLSNYHVIFWTHFNISLAALPKPTLWSRARIMHNNRMGSNNPRGFGAFISSSLKTKFQLTLFWRLSQATTTSVSPSHPHAASHSVGWAAWYLRPGSNMSHCLAPCSRPAAQASLIQTHTHAETQRRAFTTTLTHTCC